MLHGYGGHILRADLTSGQIRREKTDPQFMIEVIGGRGLNSARLYEELPRDVDPLSAENMLLIGVGPLTGTLLPASAFMTISGKSPLTGILGDSAAGGHFGAEIKQAGYDQIMMTGRSPQPCYLLIADDHVEIRDASHLWGLDIWQTTAAIRKDLNDNAVQVAAIGIAPVTYIVYETCFTLATLFHHSNFQIPVTVERNINRVLVTPRMHGIHHSVVRSELNSNYSVIFRWWDALNRSLVLNVPQSAISAGVGRFAGEEDNGILRLVALPFGKFRRERPARPPRFGFSNLGRMVE